MVAGDRLDEVVGRAEREASAAFVEHRDDHHRNAPAVRGSDFRSARTCQPSKPREHDVEDDRAWLERARELEPLLAVAGDLHVECGSTEVERHELERTSGSSSTTRIVLVRVGRQGLRIARAERTLPHRRSRLPPLEG